MSTKHEDWAYKYVRQMAIAGGSGDYYFEPTDRYYCVASDGQRAIVLGWYSADIKRDCPEAALCCSMDLWRGFLT